MFYFFLVIVGFHIIFDDVRAHLDDRLMTWLILSVGAVLVCFCGKREEKKPPQPAYWVMGSLMMVAAIARSYPVFR